MEEILSLFEQGLKILNVHNSYSGMDLKEFNTLKENYLHEVGKLQRRKDRLLRILETSIPDLEKREKSPDKESWLKLKSKVSSNQRNVQKLTRILQEKEEDLLRLMLLCMKEDQSTFEERLFLLIYRKLEIIPESSLEKVIKELKPLNTESIEVVGFLCKGLLGGMASSIGRRLRTK